MSSEAGFCRRVSSVARLQCLTCLHELLTMPRASRMLRLVAFAVPAGLAMAGVQPLLGAAAGAVGFGWAITLTAPALGGAWLIFRMGRPLHRSALLHPPSLCPCF